MKHFICLLALLAAAGTAQAKEVCPKSADGYDVCAAARGTQKMAEPELPWVLSPDYKVVSVRASGRSLKVITVVDQDKGNLPNGVTLASLSKTADKLTQELVCKDENLADFIGHGGVIANSVKLRDNTVVAKPSVSTCD
jgi:hypothetical protein